MELKEIVKTLKKHLGKIATLTLVFTLLGTVSYFILSKTYTATGSFYVQREVEGSGQDDFFTYEGYYSQQTAQNYTETVIGLIESIDIRRAALESLGIQTNEETLRKAGKRISVIRSAPQLITLSVKGKGPEEAKDMWEALSEAALNSTTTLNRESDPFLHITLVGDPVVKQNYRNLWLNTATGLAVGLLISVFSVATVEYFKEEK